jgi:hypothetical protein
MLNEIKTDLGANFKTGDDTILQKYIDDLTVIALQVSNRLIGDDNLDYYIKEAVKSAYLRRGDEGTTGSSEGSLSSSYKDIEDKLRQDIIKNGLRLIK